MGSSGSPRGRLRAPPTPCPALQPLRVLEQHRPPRLRLRPACLGPPAGHDRSQDCRGAAATAATQLRERRWRLCTELLDSLARPHRGLRLSVCTTGPRLRGATSLLAKVLILPDYPSPLLPGTQRSLAINSSLSWLTWSVVFSSVRWSLRGRADLKAFLFHCSHVIFGLEWGEAAYQFSGPLKVRYCKGLSFWSVMGSRIVSETMVCAGNCNCIVYNGRGRGCHPFASLSLLVML